MKLIRLLFPGREQITRSPCSGCLKEDRVCRWPERRRRPSRTLPSRLLPTPPVKTVNSTTLKPDPLSNPAATGRTRHAPSRAVLLGNVTSISARTSIHLLSEEITITVTHIYRKSTQMILISTNYSGLPHFSVGVWSAGRETAPRLYTSRRGGATAS